MKGISMMDIQTLQGKYVFVVRDKDLHYIDEQLRRLGFTVWQHKDCFWGTVDWAFVNIESKQFTNGRPGIAYAKDCVRHTVTLVELLIANTLYIQERPDSLDAYILELKDKYNGLKTLDFPERMTSNEEI